MNKIYLLLILIYFFSCDKKKNYTENDVKIAQSLNGTYTSIDTFEHYDEDGVGIKYNYIYSYQYLHDNVGRFVEVAPFGISRNYCNDYEVRDGIINVVTPYTKRVPCSYSTQTEKTKTLESIIHNKKYRKVNTINEGYYFSCHACKEF